MTNTYAYEFTFDARRRAALAWAAPFAAKEKAPMGTGPTCGVLLDVKDGKMNFVATDMCHLGFCEGDIDAKHNGSQDDAAPDMPIILPMTAVTAILKSKSAPELEIDLSKLPATLTVRTDTGESVFKAVEGRYPDWRKVVPTGKPQSPDAAGVCLDLKRLALTEKAMTAAARAVGIKAAKCCAHFSYYGAKKPIVVRPVLTQTDDDIKPAALIMPMRMPA